MLPRRARCVLSRLRCNGHSLLLGSYLSRIGRIENPPCSACGHSSQDTSHLILHCPATDSLRRSLFGDSLSLYDLWSRPWGVARLLNSMVSRHAPIPWKGSGNQQQQQGHRLAKRLRCKLGTLHNLNERQQMPNVFFTASFTSEYYQVGVGSRQMKWKKIKWNEEE